MVFGRRLCDTNDLRIPHVPTFAAHVLLTYMVKIDPIFKKLECSEQADHTCTLKIAIIKFHNSMGNTGVGF